MIEAVSAKDVQHLYLIAPTTGGYDYLQSLKASRVRQWNDRLWTLALMDRLPSRVHPNAVRLWERNYPSAFRLAMQRIDDGLMIVSE
jgi:hypothetical protein